ncbi:GH39 family glycosyl hydrolase [Flavobacterium fluviatile]|uniref:GH39 family glycosyl hydrolase n=1 Tax=Flavobacterium fluviatile TaxID=1862387 RepID=UPI0013D7348B|nr:glycoside hydrolase [Flavobacterium fluviatile]
MKKLLILAAALFSSIHSFGQNENRTIKVDFNKSSGKLNTMFKECIGAGRANEGLRADWQQQLAMVKKECDFKYIRFHGLLSDDMAVYREDSKGNPEYNYQYVDVLFDFIVSLKMKPFVELGFMPNALASGKETIFWWKGNVTPPKDYKKWEDLIRNLTAHFKERYGDEEVKTWYFEVWNEPNLTPGFWTGTQEEYFKLYDYAARGVKAVNKDFKVGGPATAGAGWVPETIEFTAKNNVPLDFISTHTYGVNQGYLDEFGTSGTVLSPDESSISGDVIKSHKQISNSVKPNLELHYTEWSSSYTPSDPIHDSYHSAAYILQKLKEVGNAANSMSYWVFTDIFEEAGPRFTPFHGGFGLLNTQGIKKPAYLSYYFLNKLGQTELQNADKASLVTKNSKGGVQLLFWDFTNTHPGDKVWNQTYYVQDLPSKEKGKVKVEVSGLQKGKYTLEIYKVGYKTNDVFADYLALGKPAQLTRQQVNSLKEKNNGAVIATEKVTIDATGIYSKDYKINENDVVLFNLIKQ